MDSNCAVERHAILVCGPNASGKTTTLQRAVEDYKLDPRLCTIFADNSDRETFKGSAGQQGEILTEFWRGPAQMLIVEGTRMQQAFARVHVRERSRSARIFIAWCDAETLLANIRARCEKRGKKFRDDYWSVWKAGYEGEKRYRNAMAKWMPTEPVFYYQMDTSYTNAEQMKTDLRAVLQQTLGDPQPQEVEFELR